MIQNENDIIKYKEYNKIYVPTELKNNNYIYKLNGDYIIVITNNNCVTNINTTQCDCTYYNYKQNIKMEQTRCNTNNNNQTIPITNISDDINNSVYIKKEYYQEKSIILFILIVALLFANFLTKERNSY